MDWDLAQYVVTGAGLIVAAGFIAYWQMFQTCKKAIRSARRLQEENQREVESCNLRIRGISNQCEILTEKVEKCHEADQENYQMQLANMQRKLDYANEDKRAAEERIADYVDEEMWWTNELNNRRAIFGLKPKT